MSPPFISSDLNICVRVILRPRKIFCVRAQFFACVYIFFLRARTISRVRAHVFLHAYIFFRVRAHLFVCVHNLSCLSPIFVSVCTLNLRNFLFILFMRRFYTISYCKILYKSRSYVEFFIILKKVC